MSSLFSKGGQELRKGLLLRDRFSKRSRSIDGTVYQRYIHLGVCTQGRCHYETLGVARNASPKQVKAAYFKLSKRYHPDLNKAKDAQKQFTDINSAYEVIGNPAQRREYDESIGLSSAFHGHSRRGSSSSTSHHTAGGATFHRPSNRGRRTSGPVYTYRTHKDMTFEQYIRIWRGVQFGGREYDKMRAEHEKTKGGYSQGYTDPFPKEKHKESNSKASDDMEAQQKLMTRALPLLFVLTIVILGGQFYKVNKDLRKTYKRDENGRIVLMQARKDRRKGRENKKGEGEPVVQI